MLQLKPLKKKDAQNLGCPDLDNGLLPSQKYPGHPCGGMLFKISDFVALTNQLDDV